MDSEKQRVVVAQMIAKMWKDPDYRKQVIADPKAALEAAGIALDGNMQVRVLENTATIKYLPIPTQDTLSKNPDLMGKVMAAVLPIPEGLDVRLVQETDENVSLVIPMMPEGVATSEINEDELATIAGGGYEAVNCYTTANAVAEANAAGVANVAGATDAVGAAEAAVVVAVVLV